MGVERGGEGGRGPGGGGGLIFACLPFLAFLDLSNLCVIQGNRARGCRPTSILMQPSNQECRASRTTRVGRSLSWQYRFARVSRKRRENQTLYTKNVHNATHKHQRSHSEVCGSVSCCTAQLTAKLRCDRSRTVTLLSMVCLP